MQIACRENRKPVLSTPHRHSSDELKVLGYFGSKYAKYKPTKDCSNHPARRGKFNIQQENNAIVNNLVDEILLHETQKVSDAKGAPEFLDSDFDQNNLYRVEKMSLEDTKEKLEWYKHTFE